MFRRLQVNFRIFIKLTLGVILLGALFIIVDTESVLNSVQKIRTTYLVVPILTVVATKLLFPVRERLVFRIFGRFSWSALFVGGLIVHSINIVTPSKAIGRMTAPLVYYSVASNVSITDAIKGSVLSTSFYSLSFGLTTVLGMLYLFTIAIARLISSSVSEQAMFGLIGLSGTTYLFVGMILLMPFSKTVWQGRSGRVASWLIRISPIQIPRRTNSPDWQIRSKKTLVTFGSYLLLFLFSAMLLRGIRFYYLFMGLSYNPPHIWLVLVIPVVAYSVTILPISIGGIGVAELSASIVLIRFGVPEEVAVTSVIIERLLAIYIPALLGSPLVYMLDIESLNPMDDISNITD